MDNVNIYNAPTPDGTVDYYTADIQETHDYYAGGMTMPGRNWTNGNNYRYSHNGHEKENEIFAHAQSAEYWMYDSRTLRRWERDPVVKPHESPYMSLVATQLYLLIL